MIASRARSIASAQTWSSLAVRVAVLVTGTFFLIGRRTRSHPRSPLGGRRWARSRRSGTYSTMPRMATTAKGMPFLDRYFEIGARNSTLSRELRGGLATFFTMAYIVVLNPLILGSAKDSTGAVLSQAQIAAATALVAGVMTILMGVIGRFPLALAAGLGVNAIVAYDIAGKMTWADAMGLVVIEGLLIGILGVTVVRAAIL